MAAFDEDDQNKASSSLHEKLRELRSLTNSTASSPNFGVLRAKLGSRRLHDLQSNSTFNSQGNTASIIVDASRYIEELKERVDTLNRQVESSTHDQASSSPTVTVKPQEKGFLINVLLKKSCPGLLVSILEAFEELGLEVLDARVSCTDNFCLEAVSENEGQAESIDAQVVRQAVLQAIRNCHETGDQQD